MRPSEPSGDGRTRDLSAGGEGAWNTQQQQGEGRRPGYRASFVGRVVNQKYERRASSSPVGAAPSVPSTVGLIVRKNGVASGRHRISRSSDEGNAHGRRIPQRATQSIIRQSVALLRASNGLAAETTRFEFRNPTPSEATLKTGHRQAAFQWRFLYTLDVPGGVGLPVALKNRYFTGRHARDENRRT